MKKVLYPILAVIVFFVMQVFAGVGIAVITIAKNPSEFQTIAKSGNIEAVTSYMFTGDALPWALILSGIATVCIIAALGMIQWKSVLNFKMIDWKICGLAILGAVVVIFYTDLLSEFMDFPDEMGKIFNSMASSVVGALSIGVIGPIMEELIFREAVLGWMLRGGVNKWVAITTSAVVFGLIHANPAQIPFAIVIGFIFGIIYYKTGNIVITSILHILNNSVAVLLMVLQGEEAADTKLGDLLGGPVMSLAICIPLLAVGFNCLRVFWKESRTEHFPALQTEQAEMAETDIITQEIETTNQNLINDETIL
ncbi:MAG: CPBP family intramembrane metalloprotease [Bacteroidaceae bacterium]|nr:CPBP family intramembrane metalloprotease [Bacteroidaceae bacterium]